MIRMRLLPVFIASLLVGCAGRARFPVADALPAALEGEWATPAARFRGDALLEGAVVYLERDGTGAVIGAPPPIGVRLTSQFDASRAMLVATFFDGDAVVATQQFAYDARTRTLRAREETGDSIVYHRRQARVPPSIRRMLCESRSAAVRCAAADTTSTARPSGV